MILLMLWWCLAFPKMNPLLSHVVDTSGLIHFRGVKIPVIPNRKGVDILIGQSDKLLLTVLKEQEGQKPDEPNLVFTRLGPMSL